MNTLVGLPVLAGLVAIAVAVGGGAAINERSTATPVVEGPDRLNSETAGVPPRLPAAGSDNHAAGRKSRCKNCGVVESVERIERPALEDGVCVVFDDLNIPGDYLAGESGPSKGLPTLSNMARRVAAAQAIAHRVPTTSRYRVVVRLRDGARHVFDEATSRTLRSGEFVNVI